MRRTAEGAALYPAMTPNGGSLIGVPTMVTDQMPDGQLLLFDASQLAVGGESIVLSRATSATIEMVDGSGAMTATVSLFQTNSFALRAERWCGRQRLREVLRRSA